MVAEESGSRNSRQNAETGVRSLRHISRRGGIFFHTIQSGHSIVADERKAFGLLFHCVARELKHGRLEHGALRRDETVALENKVKVQLPGCLAQHFVQFRVI